MSEALQDIARIQELTVWALLLLGFLDLLAVMTIGAVLYATRGTRRAVEDARRAAIEAEARIAGSLDRLGFYLFQKLGPVDMS